VSFYEDEKPYLQQAEDLDINSRIILKKIFIPNSEVKYYLCAADAVIQPYRSATQSGVTPLAYHFEKPMVVTTSAACLHWFHTKRQDLFASRSLLPLLLPFFAFIGWVKNILFHTFAQRSEIRLG
jgi:hypothetical protein